MSLRDRKNRLLVVLLRRFSILRLVWLRRRYLVDSGWVESVRQRAPTAADGSPLPWYTFAAIAFLEERVSPDLTVFEFGSGNSTLWWASRVRQVVACEGSSEWYTRVTDLSPRNVEVILADADTRPAYCDVPASLDREFDVIVNDGRDRVECIKRAVGCLSSDGVIVWDNADREELYRDGFALLARQGFKRLDFKGLGPMLGRGWTTTVFYRASNCLDL